MVARVSHINESWFPILLLYVDSLTGVSTVALWGRRGGGRRLLSPLRKRRVTWEGLYQGTSTCTRAGLSTHLICKRNAKHSEKEEQGARTPVALAHAPFLRTHLHSLVPIQTRVLAQENSSAPPLLHWNLDSLHLNLSFCTLVLDLQAFPSSLTQKYCVWVQSSSSVSTSILCKTASLPSSVSHMLQMCFLSALLSPCAPCMRMCWPFLLAVAMSGTAACPRLLFLGFPFAARTVAVNSSVLPGNCTPTFVVPVPLPHTTCLLLCCCPSLQLLLSRHGTVWSHRWGRVAPVATIRDGKGLSSACFANRVPHLLDIVPSCFRASVFLGLFLVLATFDKHRSRWLLTNPSCLARLLKFRCWSRQSICCIAASRHSHFSSRPTRSSCSTSSIDQYFPLLMLSVSLPSTSSMCGILDL